MGETREAHSIDIAINSRSESPKPCIFKIPAKLRRHSSKSYIPESFSFGPLYHTEKHLKETEEIKKLYLAKLLSRKPTIRTTQEEFKRSILGVEGSARKCYAFPTNHLNQDQFVDMLVLDGCFIIELLRNNEIATKKNENKSSSINNKKNNNSSSSINNNTNNNSSSNNNNNNTLDEDDPVFSVSWVLPALYHDLILLENQIPWFVLEYLFKMTSDYRPGTKSLTELALNFFDTIFTRNEDLSITDFTDINHILELLRNSLIYSSRIRQESTANWKPLPTATSLKESGIRFMKGESRTLLDITFDIKQGVLEIPPLLIDEIKCEAFRNLISYEQCYSNCGAEITSYAVFLDNLINKTKDINVLREAGVFHNWMNTKDTVEFFNSIYMDNYVKGFHYAQICDEVNEYTNRWWPRTKVAYARMFRDPIGSLSLFAATIALILTLLQTLFTILQYIE